MTATTKLKVSLTLSADLVAIVDRDARRSSNTRSGVIEQWLRRAAAAATEQELTAATAAYYHSLRSDDSQDEEALSLGLSKAAKRVAYDDLPAPRRRARR